MDSFGKRDHEEFATRSAVVSFCSFADVDARHRAVANVAVLLAKAGFSVGLCAIDSDPLNLYRYLVMAGDQRAIPEPQPSAWDLMNEFKAELARAAKVDISQTIAVESEDIVGATIAIGSLRLRRPSNYLVKLIPLIAHAGLSGSIFVLPGGASPIRLGPSMLGPTGSILIGLISLRISPARHTSAFSEKISLGALTSC